MLLLERVPPESRFDVGTCDLVLPERDLPQKFIVYSIFRQMGSESINSAVLPELTALVRWTGDIPGACHIYNSQCCPGVATL